MEVFRVGGGVAPLRRGVVDDRPLLEEGGPHRAHPVGPRRDAGFRERPVEPLGQVVGLVPELLVGPLPGQLVQARDPRGDRKRVPREGPRLVDGPDRRQGVHHVAPPAEGSHGQPAADDLAQHREVGVDPVELLRPAGRHAEPGDHLVEDEERPLLPRHLPQRVEEPRGREDDPHVAGDRLDDDRGDLSLVHLEQAADGGGVVEIGGQGMPGKGGRNAGRVGLPERERPGPGLHEHGVGVAVVAPFELHNLVPAGESPRQPDCAHRRLGARGDQPDLLYGRERPPDEVRERDLPRRGGAVARPFPRCAPDGGDDLRVGVAEDHRPPRGNVVDKRVAIDVGDSRPLRLGDEERGTAHGTERPHGGVHPAGDDLFRLAEQLFRLLRLEPGHPNASWGSRKIGRIVSAGGAGCQGNHPLENHTVFRLDAKRYYKLA